MFRQFLVALAVVAALVRAAPQAGPFFTDDVDGLEAVVTTRVAQLTNASTPDDIRKQKAAALALAALAPVTTSVADDLAAVRKTASILDAAFPGDVTFGDALQQALDGLETDVRTTRDDLAQVVTLSALPGSGVSAAKAKKAQAGVVAGDRLLDLAVQATSHSTRAAKLLAAQSRYLTTGTQLLRVRGPIAFQFGAGRLSATGDGVVLHGTYTVGTYVKSTASLAIGGLAIEDATTGAHVVVLVTASGVTGAGAYDLRGPASIGTGAVQQCPDFTSGSCTEFDTQDTQPFVGTMRVWRIDFVRRVAVGSFLFTGRDKDGSVTSTTVDSGLFRIRFRVAKHL